VAARPEIPSAVEEHRPGRALGNRLSITGRWCGTHVNRADSSSRNWKVQERKKLDAVFAQARPLSSGFVPRF